jgi:hypothetical protein
MGATEPPTIEAFAVTADTTADVIGEEVARILAAQGYAGEPVLLAIPSQKCLAASVPIETPSQIRQRETLLYQLEQCLPLAAEDMVADFVIRGHDVLGVALETIPQRTIVEALESRGIQIQSISPLAILALQESVRGNARTDPYLVLWENNEHIELLRLDGRKLSAWQFLPAEPESVGQRLAVEALGGVGPIRVMPHHLPPSLLAVLRTRADVLVEEPLDDTLYESALAIAPDVISGKEPAWIELRRDALGAQDAYRPIRGSLRFVWGAAAAFLIALSAGLLLRAYKYGQSASADRLEQATIFGEVFPGQSPPTGIRSRLESERAKMAGVKGESADLPPQRPALAVFYDLLDSVPEALRCRLLSVKLDHARIEFEGELRSHGDADTIASGLRKRGLRVQSPRTQLLRSQGVSVRMIAESGDKKPSGTGHP